MCWLQVFVNEIVVNLIAKKNQNVQHELCYRLKCPFFLVMWPFKVGKKALWRFCYWLQYLDWPLGEELPNMVQTSYIELSALTRATAIKSF